MLIWLKFLICAVIIFYAGYRLTYYGDIIAEKTGLTHAWIGFALLAVITSLPELATGISAVTFVGQPDLTIGNLFGACFLNMLTFALLDIFYRKGSLYKRASSNHIFTTALNIGILSFAALSIIMTQKLLNLTFFGVGIYSIIIFFIYLLSQRLIFKYEQAKKEEIEELFPQPRKISLFSLWSRFALFALAVILAGTWLASLGDEIAIMQNWGHSFVGTLLLAIATTLPELTVSFSALRLNLVDMSIGNLLGSNFFNIAIIFAVDLFFRKGNILNFVSPHHTITALLTILMMGLVIAGFIYKPQRKLFGQISYLSLLLIFIYFVGIFTVYNLGVKF